MLRARHCWSACHLNLEPVYQMHCSDRSEELLQFIAHPRKSWMHHSSAYDNKEKCCSWLDMRLRKTRWTRPFCSTLSTIPTKSSFRTGVSLRKLLWSCQQRPAKKRESTRGFRNIAETCYKSVHSPRALSSSECIGIRIPRKYYRPTTHFYYM